MRGHGQLYGHDPSPPGFMTWLLCESGTTFKILRTEFIFREITLGTTTVARSLQTKTEPVGI